MVKRTVWFVLPVATLLFGASAAWAQQPPPPAAPPPGAPPPVAPPVEEERQANNSIFVEGLGPGGVYSLNYERIFGDVGARLGFSYISVSATATTPTETSSAKISFITVPLTVSYLGIGSKTHIFEIGAGGALIYLSGSSSSFGIDSEGSVFTAWGTAMLGYRLQPPDGGFQFRVGASPLVGAGGFLPWGYLSLGGTF